MEEVAGLEYFYEPFNDPDSVDRWRDRYHKDFTIGMQADYRSRQPGCQEMIAQQLRSQGLILKNVAFCWYRMMPGDMIPEHSDTYSSYSRFYNVPPDSVARILILLEDWKPGYLLEVDGNPINCYKAGTWVMWKAHTPHMAGNLGSQPRYSLQITATIDETTSPT